jgi:hypothetical protein
MDSLARPLTTLNTGRRTAKATRVAMEELQLQLFRNIDAKLFIK